MLHEKKITQGKDRNCYDGRVSTKILGGLARETLLKGRLDERPEDNKGASMWLSGWSCSGRGKSPQRALRWERAWRVINLEKGRLN